MNSTNYKAFNYSVSSCNFLLDSNVLLSGLFSNILELCSAINANIKGSAISKVVTERGHFIQVFFLGVSICVVQFWKSVKYRQAEHENLMQRSRGVVDSVLQSWGTNFHYRDTVTQSVCVYRTRRHCPVAFNPGLWTRNSVQTVVTYITVSK